jgi:hypothetical protein
MLIIPWTFLILLFLLVPLVSFIIIILVNASADNPCIDGKELFVGTIFVSVILFIISISISYFYYTNDYLPEEIKLYKSAYIEPISQDNKNKFIYDFNNYEKEKIEKESCYILYGITKKHFFMFFPIGERMEHCLIGKNDIDIVLQNYPQIKMKE